MTNSILDGTEEVVVQRQWNSWQQGTVKLSDIERPRWDDISGGVQAPCPQPFIFAYTWCNALTSGEVNHSCMHGQGPHWIKICILKKYNSKAVYQHLLNLVGPKPKRQKSLSLS